MERDRDEFGRPRNARGRDALGRPLPRGVPGLAGVPDDLVLSPDETLTEAQRLLDQGLSFQAHEVLEAAWKLAPPHDRDLWQGLAQLAVGLTHLLRGNPAGASTLLVRAVERLVGYSATRPYGIDVPGLIEWAQTLTAELGNEHQGNKRRVAPSPPQLRPS